MEKISGSRKAALFLLSIGKDEAAKIISQLDEKQIESIAHEISRIESIDKTEREEVLRHFQNEISGHETAGGISMARDLLSKSIGNEKAEAILNKMNSRSLDKDFDFLNEIDSTVLYSLLLQESEQTIAVTLSFLNPKKAAETLKLFPREQQTKIAVKLANTSKTHPDAIAEIARVLRKKYEQRDTEYNESGGSEALANILNHMDKNLEDSILKELEANSPDLAEQVKEKLYTFEDIINLDSKEMRILINRIANDEIISDALRGAAEDLKKQFFNAMSMNRASDLIDLMDAKGKIALREINEARAKILNLGRELEEEKLILFKKTKDDYI